MSRKVKTPRHVIGNFPTTLWFIILTVIIIMISCKIFDIKHNLLYYSNDIKISKSAEDKLSISNMSDYDMTIQIISGTNIDSMNIRSKSKGIEINLFTGKNTILISSPLFSSKTIKLDTYNNKI